MLGIDCDGWELRFNVNVYREEYLVFNVVLFGFAVRCCEDPCC